MRYVLKLVTGLLVATSAANAGVSFTGSAGNLAATVEFEQFGTQLLVRLTNTSTFDVLVPADLLSGVFFDVSGSVPGITRGTARVAAGSSVLVAGTGAAGAVGANGNVGGEWAALSNLSGAPGNARIGISASGLNLFGPGDRFDTSQNLQGPPSPDGMQYGIVSAGDVITTANGGLSGENVIKNSVVFTFNNLPLNFDFSRIRNVSFQYGTSLTDPNYTGTLVPTPASIALFGLAGLVARRRR